MPDEATPAKKKPKAKLPGARTMEHMCKDGFTVAMVERWNPHAMVRQDMFGFCDIVAMRAGAGIIAVQACAMGSRTARIAKILAEPRAKIWLQSGGRIQVFAWRKLTRGMVREKWVPKVTEITLKDFGFEGSPEPVRDAQGAPLAEGGLFDEPVEKLLKEQREEWDRKNELDL